MQRSIVIGSDMRRRSDSQLASEPEYMRSELDALVAVPAAPCEALRADELLDWIEDGEATVRFVPDWSDESYKNAA